MPVANTPRPRLLTRLGVASAAVALLLSGCVPPGLQAKKGSAYKPDAASSASQGTGSGQSGDERETVKVGKSAALQVEGDPVDAQLQPLESVERDELIAALQTLLANDA